MAKPEPKIPVNLRIPEPLVAQLDKFVAEQTYETSRSGVIIALLRDFFEKREQHPARKPPAR